MSDALSEREQQRQTLLLRIEQDRSAIGRTLVQLRRPIQAVDRWQRGIRALLPMLPGLLLAIAATLLVLVALRRRDRHGLRLAGGHPPPQRNWLGAIQQLMVAWRLALQMQTLLRAGMASIAAPVVPPQPHSSTSAHVPPSQARSRH